MHRGPKDIRLPAPLLFIIAVAVASMVLFGCATGKYRTLYGITDVGYKAIITTDAHYATADAEKQAFMRKNVNPYRNIIQHALVAMGAIESADDAKLSAETMRILEIVTQTSIDYDPAALIAAIKTGDYDAIEVQVILLKDKILEALGVI